MTKQRLQEVKQLSLCLKIKMWPNGFEPKPVLPYCLNHHNWVKEMNIYMHVCLLSHSVMSDSLWLYERLLCPWDSPGKNNEAGYHFFLREIFLTQGSNLHLPHCRQIPYCLSHQGSPNMYECMYIYIHVKAMVFPVVMYGCESWTVKKAKSRRIDAFTLWCWKRHL